MENAKEVLEQLHEHMTQIKNDGEYIEAALTCSLTVGFAGATLQGWITYNNQHYGKVYFEAKMITQHAMFFAGAGALPSVQVLVPERIKNEGRFEASGSFVGGGLMLFSQDGTQVLEAAFPVAGAGAIYWSAQGEVHFTITK